MTDAGKRKLKNVRDCSNTVLVHTYTKDTMQHEGAATSLCLCKCLATLVTLRYYDCSK